MGRYDFQKSQTPLVGGQSRNANQLAKPYLMMFCASEKVRPGKWINLQKICAECNGALPGGWGFRSFVDDQNRLNARSGKSKRYVPQKTRCFPADFLWKNHCKSLVGWFQNGRWLSEASARSLASLAPALWLTALCPGTSPRGLGRLQPFGTAKQGKWGST